MTYDAETAGRSRFSAAFTRGALSADNLDRILLGACAAVWLVALGAGVAATVALVDLGRGHPETSGTSETPWLLYAVIAISAVVIVGAVPLLLRARRIALAEPRPAQPMSADSSGQVGEAPTEKLRVFGTATDRPVHRPGYSPAPPVPSRLPLTGPEAAVDQLWLRCALVIASAMGLAMVAIGVATYLMAVDNDGAAWAAYVVAALITLAIPVIPWLYLRQLRALLESSAP
jgi:hypothetical protein